MHRKLMVRLTDVYSWHTLSHLLMNFIELK
jgi:hypothetical protein